MLWLYILFLVFLVAGFVNGIFGLKTLRSKAHPQAEIVWQQQPLSPWRYETLTMLAVAIHSLGVICLAVILTSSVVRSYTFISFARSGWVVFMAIFAVIFTSYIAGVVLAFHLARQWIRPISYGVSKDGLWYGGARTGWGCFSHYEIGPDNGLISLYSSYSPALRTWVIQPPPGSFTSVLAILQQNLSMTQPTDGSISWQRSPTALILGMSVMVALAVLPAIWGWLNHQSWAWIYCLIAFSLVLALGNKLITVFDGRGKSQTQKEPVTQ